MYVAKFIQIEKAILFRLAGSVKLTQPKWRKFRNGTDSGTFFGSIKLDGAADTGFLVVEPA